MILICKMWVLFVFYELMAFQPKITANNQYSSESQKPKPTAPTNTKAENGLLAPKAQK
jgi:hypothetical protein